MSRFPPPPPGAERRVHPRHDVVVSVEVAHDDVVVIAALTDISHGGAFIELSDPDAVSVGVRVRVHLSVGGHDVCEEAKVVRVTTGAHAGFALAWIAPGAAVAKVVEQLIGVTGRATRTGPGPAEAPAPIVAARKRKHRRPQAGA